MLTGRSILFKFTLVFGLSIALVGAAYYLLLRNVYYSELRSQAQTIADNVESFGAWVSRYGRVWVKDDASSFLGQMAVVDAAATNGSDVNGAKPQHAIFYSKNPALAQREFSEAVAASDNAGQFRMTSDNYMNPLNKPDPFEKGALKIIKAQQLKEYSALDGAKFRYARALYHKESCIKCHGRAASAPLDVINKYGSENGFDFKVGDVAGIISVSLPAKSIWRTFVEVVGPIEIGLVVAAFLISFLFMHFGVVKQVRGLTDVANRLSTGQNHPLPVKGLKQNSKNELDQLVLAVYRLRNSLQIAIKRMRSKA